MRKSIIAGNWKMNNNISQTTEFFSELLKNTFADKENEIIIFPPFTSLAAACEKTENSPIAVGAQNFYCESKGAFTGEISPEMLREIGTEYVLAGHSERRNVFGEDNNLINRKINFALEKGLKTILCVGELLEEREAGKAEETVKMQLEKNLANISKEKLSSVVIAYEPVWAIGTGKTATGDEAGRMIKFIRDTIEEMYGKNEADRIRILYGGSVKPENINDIMGRTEIDGVLVGGASLKADSFIKLINYREK